MNLATKPPLKIEPLFDFITGEIYGYEECPEEPVLPLEESRGFLTVPPGFSRGVHFDPPEGFKEEEQPSSFGSMMIEPMEKVSLAAQQADTLPEIKPQAQSASLSKPEEEHNALDLILPESSIPSFFAKPKSFRKPVTESTSWARAIDANHVPADYESVVSELAFKFPFELDTFQKQAIYRLERGESVFVAAHTSAGKTAVAEYAIALAMKHLTKAVYTSPIKALSNQKFRDFKNTFHDVGLLTGDVQLNAEASCLIMTTEILRSMLYRGADLVSDIEFVIFDEVHYVNDQERGVVWEEVIIMLPSHVNIIMLSATIPNTLEFADWVGRTKRKEIFVISTLKRPVPLEHFLYLDKNLIKIVDQNKNFLEPGYKQALAIQRGDSPTAKKGVPSMTAGAVAPRNSQGGIYRGAKQERNLWIEVLYVLKKKTLLPAVVFTFSKRKCEENADGLATMDFNSGLEKSTIHIFLETSVAKLKSEDRTLPQISRMRDMLGRGVAVHHSGLLPIMKEAVEILFSRGLVKVLFATETFAMGVNMPARTVVFSHLRKHDGNGFRNLLPGEYTQMAGRAGRRGLDPTGTVIIACPEEVPMELALRTMILGQSTKLVSQFRLTYTMILNLLRIEALHVEEMIKKSFSENATQKQLPSQQRKLVENEALLAKAESLDCSICETDLSEFYSTSVTIIENGRVVHERILSDTKLASRLLEPGRVVIVNNGFLRNVPAVVLKLIPGAYESKSESYYMSCIVLVKKQQDSLPAAHATDPLPLPPSHINRPDLAHELGRETCQFMARDLVMICSSRIKVPADLGSTTIYRSKDLDEIQDAFFSWFSENTPVREVEIPHVRSLEIDEKKLNRVELIKQLPFYACQACPDLLEHYGIFHRRRLLMEQLAELRFKLSDNSLVLLPEYHARIALLKSLGYVDQAGNVQLKGRVACELNTVSELIVTELLFDNSFASCDAAEIVALLSTMVFQERHAGEPELSGALKEGVERIKNTAMRISILQQEHGIESGTQDRLCFGLVEVVYQWAKGTPFTEIVQLTEVLEGSIVRCIVRLDETCRELRGAARIMGDPLLFKKMEEASQSIKRDICFASSLYL